MIEKVVIIGSGPAGYTAGIYAGRANLNPVLYADEPRQIGAFNIVPGGQLMFTTEVENYPGFPKGVMGPEMMELFRQQAEHCGCRMVGRMISKVDFSRRPFQLWDSEDQLIEAHAVIVATGATANWLGLPNEQRLAQSGGGVSACAVCDGALPMFRNQPLAVVGGGDSAIEEATYLTKFASKVYLIHRRDKLRASKAMQDRALNNHKMEMIWNKVVVDVLGDNKITGVKLHDTVTQQESTLELRGLFIGIGHTPATAFLKNQMQLDEKGYIVLKDLYRTTTSVDGVFAAGDVADSVYRQAITAAGMGCKAALDAERWLAAQGIE
ncbi:MAG: Thioredoxin reductase [Phycisphaerae bacterium]|nr:Thioredoxin reductase [Phycisphaerae bacterium]